ELAAARKGTEHWIVKLSPVDTAAALEQARMLEQRTFGWLSLGWCRLRSVLNRSYGSPLTPCGRRGRRCWRRSSASTRPSRSMRTPSKS
ncbi:MAG TPA: hypothetical protein PLV92_14275, partial [Pirellulaceae bacterium]|nr:hypothetical protein [Pirellulaceae bacterium]